MSQRACLHVVSFKQSMNQKSAYIKLAKKPHYGIKMEKIAPGFKLIKAVYLATSELPHPYKNSDVINAKWQVPNTITLRFACIHQFENINGSYHSIPKG